MEAPLEKLQDLRQHLYLVDGKGPIERRLAARLDPGQHTRVLPVVAYRKEAAAPLPPVECLRPLAVEIASALATAPVTLVQV